MAEPTKEVAVIDPQGTAAFQAMLGDRCSPAIQIMLNDQLWERCTAISVRMSKAEGAIPRHLLQKPEACFAVVCQSMTWKLDPHAVARCTYQTPGGSMGFMGSLCQAILENSGRIKGQIKFEHFGDWDKIQGNFVIAKSSKGNDYPKINWKPADEEGLGVVVSAQVIGEDEPRTFKFLLKQAFPRNSTLWATDPMTQICYTAVRRFASVAAPAIFMGVPFDREEIDDSVGTMVNVTPARPLKVSDAKAGSKGLDDAYKATVGRAAAPAPQETVIEPEPEPEETNVAEEPAQAPEEETPADDVGQDDSGDGSGDQGGGDEDNGFMEPEAEQTQAPAPAPAPVKAAAPPKPAPKAPPAAPPQPRASTPTPAAPKPQTAAAPTPATAMGRTAPATAPPAPAPLTPLTPEDTKKLRGIIEKGVVAASDVISLDALQNKYKIELRRLKITDDEVYGSLIAMLTDKKTHLLNEEG